MSPGLSALILLAVGSAGGFLGYRFKLPGGAILWALFPVAGTQLALADLQPLAPEFRVAGQILIGIAIGSTVSRNPIVALRPLVVPVAISLAVLLTVAFASGLAFAQITGIPVLTALFATTPGGATDMAAAAIQLGADAPLIAGYHMIRQLLIFVVLSLIFARAFRPPDGGGAPAGGGGEN